MNIYNNYHNNITNAIYNVVGSSVKATSESLPYPFDDTLIAVVKVIAINSANVINSVANILDKSEDGVQYIANQTFGYNLPATAAKITGYIAPFVGLYGVEYITSRISNTVASYIVPAVTSALLTHAGELGISSGMLSMRYFDAKPIMHDHNYVQAGVLLFSSAVSRGVVDLFTSYANHLGVKSFQESCWAIADQYLAADSARARLDIQRNLQQKVGVVFPKPLQRMHYVKFHDALPPEQSKQFVDWWRDEVVKPKGGILGGALRPTGEGSCIGIVEDRTITPSYLKLLKEIHVTFSPYERPSIEGAIKAAGEAIVKPTYFSYLADAVLNLCLNILFGAFTQYAVDKIAKLGQDTYESNKRSDSEFSSFVVKTVDSAYEIGESISKTTAYEYVTFFVNKDIIVSASSMIIIDLPQLTTRPNVPILMLTKVAFAMGSKGIFHGLSICSSYLSEKTSELFNLEANYEDQTETIVKDKATPAPVATLVDNSVSSFNELESGHSSDHGLSVAGASPSTDPDILGNSSSHVSEL